MFPPITSIDTPVSMTTFPHSLTVTRLLSLQHVCLVHLCHLLEGRSLSDDGLPHVSPLSLSLITILAALSSPNKMKDHVDIRKTFHKGTSQLHRTHDLRSGSKDHHPSKKLGAENHMLQPNI